MQIDRTDARAESGCIANPDSAIQNMHDVFSNQYRRAILYQLQKHDDPMAVTTVSNRVLERKRVSEEGSEREDTLDGETPTRALRTHILKMEEFGLLGYDRRTDTVWIPDAVTISVASPWGDSKRSRPREVIE